MDGKVISDFYDNKYFFTHPPKYIDIDSQKKRKKSEDLYTLEEKEDITNRLRKLGYL
jgi:hypothetical protein